MATQDQDLPWDDQTEQFVEELDELTKLNDDISIKDLLLNPEKYTGKKDLPMKVSSVQKTIDTYFSEMLEGMPEEQRRLEQELSNTDLFYNKIDGIIQAKTASSNVPYVEPYTVYINRDQREEIVVSQYTQDIDQLIGKFIASAEYVANLSGKYLQHRFGSWLFSCSKAYVLTINPPSSIVMDINNSKSLILDMLSSLSIGAEPEKPE